jgi:plasmid stabilization system protein ParE
LVKKQLPVHWTPLALGHLKAIHDYIALDSTAAAKRVQKAFFRKAKTLGKFPEKYSRESYLDDLPNNYRSVPLWSYKIFEVTLREVFIVRIFHTHQDPGRLRKDRDS